MKHIFLLCTCLFISSKVFSQAALLTGTWVNKDCELLQLSNNGPGKEDESLLGSLSQHMYLSYYPSGDTLRLQRKCDLKSGSKQTYEWLLLKKTATSCILKPLNKSAKQFFYNKTTVQFTLRPYNMDRSMRFEKLVFHSTACYGNCPVIDLEIDSSRNVYLQALHKESSEEKRVNGQKPSGIFTGTLSISQYNLLLELLGTSCLKNLQFTYSPIKDAPETTLIIYQNGQRKYLKSKEPPAVAFALIRYLLKLQSENQLTRSSVVRELEK